LQALRERTNITLNKDNTHFNTLSSENKSMNIANKYLSSKSPRKEGMKYRGKERPKSGERNKKNASFVEQERIHEMKTEISSLATLLHEQKATINRLLENKYKKSDTSEEKNWEGEIETFRAQSEKAQKEAEEMESRLMRVEDELETKKLDCTAQELELGKLRVA